MFNMTPDDWLPTTDCIYTNDLAEGVCRATGLDRNDFYLMQNGKILANNEPIHNETSLYIQLRVLGGKGGFGSMLRAIGAQIEKTTNREACRDLSGRRLRDINEEKRLKAWIEKNKDCEAEAEEKVKKKIAKLLHVPKHEFKDEQYEEARSKVTEKVNNAVDVGLQKAMEMSKEKPNLKRKADNTHEAKKKKPGLWLSDDLDGSSLSSDSDDSCDDDKPSTSKKIK